MIHPTHQWKDKILNKLISWKGQTYSQELGIDLTLPKSEEIFKWFLAAVLFGTRISETIVKNTFRRVVEYDILTPEKIIQLGWDKLVQVLDSGGYVRYDFKTADKLLEVMENLKKKYHGNLNSLHQQADNNTELEQKLQDLGKGIGPTTVQIFLRELRPIWEKARPPVSPLSILCAKNLGIIPKNVENNNFVLESLIKIWIQCGYNDKDFPMFEAALLRVGKDYCRKNRCSICLLNSLCKEVH